MSTVPLKILGIYDMADYSRKRTPVMTEDHQTLRVQVNGLYSRSAVLGLIEGSASIPSVTQQNSAFPWLYCVEVTPEQDKEVPDIWNVSIVWRSLTNVQDKVLDPTQRAVLISRGTYKLQDIPDFDFDNKPVATAAGEPINYPYQRSFPTYTFEKFLPSFPTWCGVLSDFVNSDSVTIYGQTFNPWELFLPDINIGHLEYQGEFSFYPSTFTLYVNTKPNGWKTFLRNAGKHERKFLYWVSIKGAIVSSLIAPPYVGQKSIQIGAFTYKPVFALEAIKLGTPGKYEYPSSDVLLDGNGRAFRQALASDPPDGSSNSGPIIGLQNSTTAASTGITQKQWDASTLQLRFANPISFNQYLPLR